ncbi:uncharacterized protein [Scyliorhinus torazame]|uniref:uncharacterized protein isoform X1 n=2 Tax=Scyliorhinus torazame TaxID=75743 RepID=UPI003B58DC46
MELKRYQKINHFPGMNEICRKDLLARNLNRMLKLYPKDYNIFPKTWCLPSDYHEFMVYSRARKSKTFICKPDSECQGRGIFLTKNTSEVKPGEDMVCQVYIPKPFILDGFKFDLRLYVLITSCDPLRIYFYDEGLIRFATTKYSEPTDKNLEDICMHLTNYSINKHSKNFVRDETKGSKRKLSFFNKYMENNAYDLERLWNSIEDVIIKTILAAYPVLKHNYLTCFPNHISGSACFEILGFDILLDQTLKPWLLEVNHSPSFTTDSKLDQEVKDNLLNDTFCMINLGACDRRKVLEEERRRTNERLLHIYKSREDRADEIKTNQAAWVEQMEKYEDENIGNFRRIYPFTGSEKYDKFLKCKHSLFQETIASKAREECARQMRQEIRQKQEQKELLLKGRKYPERNLRGESQNQKNHLSAVLMKQKPSTPLPLAPTSLAPETATSPTQGTSETEKEYVEKSDELPDGSTEVDAGLNAMEHVHGLCVSTTASENQNPTQTQAKELDQNQDWFEDAEKSETEAIGESQPGIPPESQQEVELESQSQPESQPATYAQTMVPEESQGKVQSECKDQIQAAVQEQVQQEAQDQAQTEDLGQAPIGSLAHHEAEDQNQAEACNQVQTGPQDQVQSQAQDQAHQEAQLGEQDQLQTREQEIREHVPPETWDQVQAETRDQAQQEAQHHAQDQVQSKDWDQDQAEQNARDHARPKSRDQGQSEYWDQAQQETQAQAQAKAWDQSKTHAQGQAHPKAQKETKPEAQPLDIQSEIKSDAETQSEAHIQSVTQAENQFQAMDKICGEIIDEAQEWTQFVPNSTLENGNCSAALEIPEELDTKSMSSLVNEEEPKDACSITSVKSTEKTGSSSQLQPEPQIHQKTWCPPNFQFQFQTQPETQTLLKGGYKGRRSTFGNHYFTSQMIKRMSMALKHNRNQVCPPSDVNYCVQTDTTETSNKIPNMMEEISSTVADQHNSNCICWKRNANRIFSVGRLLNGDSKSCFTNHRKLQRKQVTEMFHNTFVNSENVTEDKSRRNLCVVSLKAPTIQRLGCAHFTKPSLRQKDLNNLGSWENGNRLKPLCLPNVPIHLPPHKISPLLT